MKKNIVDTYARRLFGEIPTVVFGIGIVIGCFVGYYIYAKRHTDTTNSVGASMTNAIAIIVLGIIYRKIAFVLAKWENHQYADDWENSLVTKNFAF